MKRNNLKMFIAVNLMGILMLGTGCTSQSKAAQAGSVSRQEMMAKMHEQMARCLRSGKSHQECHHQMAHNCPMMQDGKCPMMEEMMGSEGMMGKGMMGQCVCTKPKSTNSKKTEKGSAHD